MRQLCVGAPHPPIFVKRGCKVLKTNVSAAKLRKKEAVSY